MAELTHHLSVLSIISVLIFALLVAWLLLARRIKHHPLSLTVTILLVAAIFIGPVIIKTVMTGGFLLPISDQTFMMTYMQKYQHFNTPVDPLIKGVAPYYPPLFFYMAGKAASLLGIEDILLTFSLANLLGITTILLLVVSTVFTVIREIPPDWKLPLAVLFIFIFFAFFDFDFLMGKSYEVISYLLMLHLIISIDRRGSDFSPIKAGILVGIILMLYFYSILVLVPAWACYLFFSKQFNRRTIFKIVQTGAIAAGVSLPYTWPLLKQLTANILSKQAAYVHMEVNLATFYPYIPDLNTLVGLCLVVSTLIFYWTIARHHLMLSCHLPIVYSFYLLNLLAIAFWERPIFIISRLWPFAEVLFYAAAIFILTRLVKYSIEKHAREKAEKILMASLLICLILAYSAALNSNLLRTPDLRRQEQQIARRAIPSQIYQQFKSPSPQIISNYRALGIHYPVFYFLPLHLIYGNPLARLKDRQEYLKELQHLRGETLHRAMSSSPFGTIDALVGEEKDGQIEIKIYPETTISLKPPHTFTFQVDHFTEPHFIKRRVDPFLILLLQESAR